jgi:hypothetical protein
MCDLLTVNSEEDFRLQVNDLKKSFPKVERWLDWHIARGRFIFPSMASTNFSHMSSNTNAQESLGGDIQSTALRKKLSIGEAMEHLY